MSSGGHDSFFIRREPLNAGSSCNGWSEMRRRVLFNDTPQCRPRSSKSTPVEDIAHCLKALDTQHLQSASQHCWISLGSLEWSRQQQQDKFDVEVGASAKKSSTTSRHRCPSTACKTPEAGVNDWLIQSNKGLCHVAVHHWAVGGQPAQDALNTRHARTPNSNSDLLHQVSKEERGEGGVCV